MPHSIGLVSDTHGWVHPFLHTAFEGCDLIVHAGDIGTVEVLEELGTIAPVAAVKGNIDGGDLRFLPERRIEQVGMRRIAVVHIAGSPRSPRREIRDWLRLTRPDVVVVGHSHIPVVGRVEGALWVNPGAAGREGHHDERFAARIHVSDIGEITMDRVLLGPRWESPDDSQS